MLNLLDQTLFFHDILNFIAEEVMPLSQRAGATVGPLGESLVKVFLHNLLDVFDPLTFQFQNEI